MPLSSLFDKKRLKLRLAIGAVLFIGITWATMTGFLNSEPYEFATHFARTDQRVVAVTGQPQNVSLRFTRAFRYSIGETTGEANMTLKSVAANGEFDVLLELSKRAGRWHVNRAEIFPENTAPLILINESCQSPCQ